MGKEKRRDLKAIREAEVRGVAQRLRKLAREREADWMALGFWIRQGYKVEAGNTSRGAGLGGAVEQGWKTRPISCILLPVGYQYNIQANIPVGSGKCAWKEMLDCER